MTDPKRGIIAVVGLAAETAEKLADIGHGYQALAESLMYDEHGVHYIGTDLEAEGALDWLVPDAKRLRQSQQGALTDLDTTDAASIVRKLKALGSESSARAMERLWRAVSKVLQSTDLGTPDGRTNAEGLSAIFEADFYDLHRVLANELDRLAGEPVRPRPNSYRSLVRPVASTDDGDLAVGPNYFNENESAEFIARVADELRQPIWPYTEIAPLTFLPNTPAGHQEVYPVASIQLYVKPVTLRIGSMAEVVAAWLEDRLKYNTTADDVQEVDDMVCAVLWLSGDRSATW